MPDQLRSIGGGLRSIGSEFSNSNAKKITLELVEFYTPIFVGRDLHIPNPTVSYVTVISSLAGKPVLPFEN